LDACVRVVVVDKPARRGFAVVVNTPAAATARPAATAQRAAATGGAFAAYA